jgi:hypothetical protein
MPLVPAQITNANIELVHMLALEKVYPPIITSSKAQVTKEPSGALVWLLLQV